MNKTLLAAALGLVGIFIPTSGNAFEISFDGSAGKIIKETPPSSTGLSSLFVIRDLSEVTAIRFSGAEVSKDFRVSMFSSLGGGYAQECAISISGNDALLMAPKGNVGYIVEESGRQYCFWIVDYSSERFSISDVRAADEQDCNMTKLSVSASGTPIKYYSINGRQNILSRGIKLEYSRLVWDSDVKLYRQEEVSKELESLTNSIMITPALNCNTSIRISGDRFLQQWGEEVEYNTEVIKANGIEVQTSVEQLNLPEEEESSNMIKGGDDSLLGGSAPAEFIFTSYVTDAVEHTEWQIADDEDFEYIRYRFNEQDLHYTFDKEGTFYVRFVGSNSDGSCEAYGETYTVGIGASDLRIPNAFSPDGDGINDVWKVGYRSLVKFKCTIFDSRGAKLFYFDKPELGWDGMRNGTPVAPGVYYYVIEAEGADGRKYKKGGDINIIRYKKLPNRIQTD